MAKSRIVDPTGKPFEIPKPERELVGEPTKWGSRSVQSEIAQIITLAPRQIREWLLSAETGDLQAQCALFEEMERRDAELDGHLRTRKNGVASLPFEIVPADESPEAADAAAYCEEVVGQIGAEPKPGQAMRGIRAAIFDLLDAIPKGFAALEIEWETTDSKWRPRMLHWRPQRWFAVEDDGMTLYLRGQGYGEKVELNPTNWIIHTAQARSGFLNNWSLLKSCARPFIMRHYAYKDWLGFAEVYGMPPRIGRLREGVPWNSPEATELAHALEHMGMDMWAMVREGNAIEVLDVQRAGEGAIFPKLLEAAEKELTKAILGQLLTSGGEAGGSYALGKVQNLIRGDLLETDALALDETMTKELLAPIVILNKGPQAPVPKWHTILEEEEDLDATAGTLVKLGQALPGFKVSEKWAREKFSIPEPETEEDAIPLGSGAGGAPMFSALHRTDRTHRTYERKEALAQAVARRAVRPERGLEWLRERRIATPETWERLSDAGKQRAWYVSGLQAQPTAQVAQLMTEALENGRTIHWFLGQLEDRGLSVPGAEEAGPGQMAMSHAELVYGTNLAETRQADNWQKAYEAIAERPVGEWMLGAAPCPICEPLRGKRAPLDGEFFANHWPPLHHGCMCDVITLSEQDLGEGRVDDTVPLLGGEVWRFNRGDAYYIESRGQAPRTEAGRRDAELLAALKPVGDYV